MDMIRGNGQRPAPSRVQQNAHQPHETRVKRTRMKLWHKLVGGALLLLAVVAIYAWPLVFSPQSINTNGYQIVYLANNQAYFGKLQNTSGEYLYMKTPYTAQDVKQAADAKDAQSTTTLLKVRDQLYGPDDSIAIRADQVAFWQNLRDDSKVVQAIKNKQ